MSDEEKNEVAQRLTARVSTGLLFIENYLFNNKSPDAAWIRNIYILLSFYSELLLKAIFVIEGNFTDTPHLDKVLKENGHNLKLIGEKIGKTNLLKFGIKDIQYIGNEYLVESTDGDFMVKDFTDIRYDFLDGRVRLLYGNEHEKFKKQIEIMLKNKWSY